MNHYNARIWIFLWICTLHFALSSTSTKQYILRQTTITERVGSIRRSHGVYGGAIDVENNEQSKDPNQISYGSYLINTVVETGVDIRTMSYDPLSGQLLMHVNKTGLTLLRSRPCPTQGDWLKVMFDKRHMTAAIDDTTNEDFAEVFPQGLSGVAMYKSKVYFLLLGFYNSNGRTMTKLSLRMFDGCTHQWRLLYLTEPFNIIHCSKFIADIFEIDRSKSDTDDWSSVTQPLNGSMKIVPGNGGLIFFTLIYNTTKDSPTVDLIQISSKQGSVKTLSQDATAKLPTSLAGIDYKDGSICWSTGAKVFCSSYSQNKLQNKRVIVDTEIDKDKVMSICPDDATITGIAISESNSYQSTLYFGCRENVFGMGLAVTQKTGDNYDTSLYKVTDTAGNPLQGVQIILTETFFPDCILDTFMPTTTVTLTSGSPRGFYLGHTLFWIVILCLFFLIQKIGAKYKLE